MTRARRALPFHLFLALLGLAACRGTVPARPAAPPALSVPPGQRVVLISLDGASSRELHRLWDEGALGGGGFARFFREGRVAEAMVPVDPTLTAVNHISLATGFPPGATGIVSNRFQPAGAPFGEVVSGFAAPIGTETLWEAAHRQGLRVGIVTWPGADDTGTRRRGDWGMAYVGPSDHPSALAELSRADWRPAAEGAGAGLASHSPLLAARVELPDEAGGRIFDLLAVDRTDDGRTGYDAVAMLPVPPPPGPAAPAAVAAGGWTRSLTPGPPGPSVSWSKLLAVAPDLASVRLYFGAAYRNQTYPQDFARELETAGLLWPGPPDDRRLDDTWTGRPGIDVETWTEQTERFAGFFFDALRLGARARRWDLLLGYVPAIDEAGHRLSLLDPRQPGFSAERREACARGRLRVWQAVDRALARLLAELDLRTTTVVVVSDHGMAPIHTRIDPNVLLRDAGLLVSGPDGRLDPDATAAYAVSSGGVSHLYLDPETPPEERAARLAAIRELLATFETEGKPGQPERPIERILTRAEAAPAGLGHPNAGDLVLFAKPGYTFHEGALTAKVAEPAGVYGMHGHLAATNESLEAIFLALGAGVEKGPLGKVRTTEVAGRVARWLGIEPPRREAPPE